MQDIKLDKNDDIVITKGDFEIACSDKLHQKHIIKAEKGEYKQHPELGVGIEKYLNGEEYTAMLIEIKKHLEYDGMIINDVSVNKKGELTVDGKYKENGKV